MLCAIRYGARVVVVTSYAAAVGFFDSDLADLRQPPNLFLEPAVHGPPGHRIELLATSGADLVTGALARWPLVTGPDLGQLKFGRV